MPRTDVNAVQDVLGDQYDPSKSLVPFINIATLIVDRVVACAAAKGVPLTDDEALQLENLLAAHFYGSADRYYTQRSTGKASGSFMGKSELGLDGTLYGQNAKLLDASGCLTAMDKRQVAGLTWLGKRLSEQIPYDQRN